MIRTALLSVVDPFVQNLDVAVLWRLEFTVQRLINWLVTTDMAGIGTQDESNMKTECRQTTLNDTNYDYVI